MHVVSVALLAAIIALGFLKKVADTSSLLLFPVSLAFGVGAAVWYESEKSVRTFATVLAAAPPLFLFLFLFSSPVHKLVLTGEAKAQAAKVDSKTPVVMVSFDEFPIDLPPAPGREHRRRPLPQLRPLRPPGDVVSQHDDRGGRDPVGDADRDQRRAPEEGRAAHLPGLPPEPLHRAGRRATACT